MKNVYQKMKRFWESHIYIVWRQGIVSWACHLVSLMLNITGFDFAENMTSE
jgi:hypothetical protein